MKQNVLLLSLLMFMAVRSWGQQFVLIDDTLTWTKASNVQPTQQGPTNWKSPVNYMHGRAYLRYECLDKPSFMTIGIHVCMWQNNYSLENCSDCFSYSDTAHAVYYHDLEIPANWWKNGGKSLDWSKSFQQITVIHKDTDCDGKLMQVDYCGKACYQKDDIDQHMPITFRATIVVVPEGQKLVPPADWKDCPSAWL